MRLFLLADANSVHTRRWVTALSGTGIEIFLFSRDTSVDPWYETLHNVTVYGFSAPEVSKSRVEESLFRKITFYLPLLNTLKEKIKVFRPDLVHAHFASIYGLYGALCGFRPFLLSVWGSDVYEIPRKSIVNRVLLHYTLARADYLFSTSHAMAKETSRYTSKPIRVVPFGVDTGYFCKPPVLQPKTPFTIGTVKTLHPRYGIDTLIEAYALLINKYFHRPFSLVIAGEGKERAALEKKAMDLGIEDKVRFVGKIPHEQVPEFIARLDVFVALSRQESFGVAAIEAMACECPVVVSDAEGFREVVKNGETGWIVPRENPKAAAAAIEKLLNNPPLMEKMGRQGRARVQELYEWDKNVAEMANIYLKISGQR